MNESKTWSEAEEHCIEKFGGHLVTIPDLAVELFLNYILSDQEESLWIGIQMQVLKTKKRDYYKIIYNYLQMFYLQRPYLHITKFL